MTLKRFDRIDERHVELRPESHNLAHRVMKLDLAKHILRSQHGGRDAARPRTG